MPQQPWPELDTPCLRIDLDRLERNLEEMAALASSHGLVLRPHIKTHKMAALARRQLALGAVGLTVAKLSEAEALAKAGLKTFFICYPLIGALKLRRLRDLSREAEVMTIVESAEGARGLAEALAGEGRPLDVLLKVDAGMHRVGVEAERALELAEQVASERALRLRGVCLHEGPVYGEPDPARRALVAREQAATLAAVAAALRDQGHEIEIVSAGSTPGAAGMAGAPGLTELRPGNYVFYDLMQVGLGVADIDRCALSVVATVVSHAAPDRAVIDAGSKALTSDRGAHGMAASQGYGAVLGRPNIQVERLSEEHGWLRLGPGETVAIGDQLEIIPNHACPVANNFPFAAVTRGGAVLERWSVDARGCMT